MAIEHIQRIRAAMAADLKKTAVLGVLLVVLVVVTIRLFGGAGPEEVAAAPATPMPNLTPAATTPEPAAVGERVVPTPIAMASSPVPAGHPVAAGPAEDEPIPLVVVNEMDRTLLRDPFNVPNWGIFPPARANSDYNTNVASPGGNILERLLGGFSQAMKSQRTAQRLVAEEITEAAAGLELQATMTGREPTAYISGKIIRVGDVINGMRVLEIHERRVILDKSGHIVGLTMR